MAAAVANERHHVLDLRRSTLRELWDAFDEAVTGITLNGSGAPGARRRDLTGAGFVVYDNLTNAANVRGMLRTFLSGQPPPHRYLFVLWDFVNRDGYARILCELVAGVLPDEFPSSFRRNAEPDSVPYFGTAANMRHEAARRLVAGNTLDPADARSEALRRYVAQANSTVYTRLQPAFREGTAVDGAELRRRKYTTSHGSVEALLTTDEALSFGFGDNERNPSTGRDRMMREVQRDLVRTEPLPVGFRGADPKQLLDILCEFKPRGWLGGAFQLRENARASFLANVAEGDMVKHVEAFLLHYMAILATVRYAQLRDGVWHIQLLLWSAVFGDALTESMRPLPTNVRGTTPAQPYGWAAAVLRAMSYGVQRKAQRYVDEATAALGLPRLVWYEAQRDVLVAVPRGDGTEGKRKSKAADNIPDKSVNEPPKPATARLRDKAARDARVKLHQERPRAYGSLTPLHMQLENAEEMGRQRGLREVALRKANEAAMAARLAEAAGAEAGAEAEAELEPPQKLQRLLDAANEGVPLPAGALGPREEEEARQRRLAAPEVAAPADAAASEALPWYMGGIPAVFRPNSSMSGAAAAPDADPSAAPAAAVPPPRPPLPPPSESKVASDFGDQFLASQSGSKPSREKRPGSAVGSVEQERRVRPVGATEIRSGSLSGSRAGSGASRTSGSRRPEAGLVIDPGVFGGGKPAALVAPVQGGHAVSQRPPSVPPRPSSATPQRAPPAEEKQTASPPRVRSAMGARTEHAEAKLPITLVTQETRRLAYLCEQQERGRDVLVRRTVEAESAYVAATDSTTRDAAFRALQQARTDLDAARLSLESLRGQHAAAESRLAALGGADVSGASAGIGGEISAEEGRIRAAEEQRRRAEFEAAQAAERKRDEDARAVAAAAEAERAAAEQKAAEVAAAERKAAESAAAEQKAAESATVEQKAAEVDGASLVANGDASLDQDVVEFFPQEEEHAPPRVDDVDAMGDAHGVDNAAQDAAAEEAAAADAAGEAAPEAAAAGAEAMEEEEEEAPNEPRNDEDGFAVPSAVLRPLQPWKRNRIAFTPSRAKRMRCIMEIKKWVPGAELPPDDVNMGRAFYCNVDAFPDFFQALTKRRIRDEDRAKIIEAIRNFPRTSGVWARGEIHADLAQGELMLMAILSRLCGLQIWTDVRIAVDEQGRESAEMRGTVLNGLVPSSTPPDVAPRVDGLEQGNDLVPALRIRFLLAQMENASHSLQALDQAIGILYCTPLGTRLPEEGQAVTVKWTGVYGDISYDTGSQILDAAPAPLQAQRPIPDRLSTRQFEPARRWTFQGNMASPAFWQRVFGHVAVAPLMDAAELGMCKRLAAACEFLRDQSLRKDEGSNRLLVHRMIEAQCADWFDAVVRVVEFHYRKGLRIELFHRALRCARPVDVEDEADRVALVPQDPGGTEWDQWWVMITRFVCCNLRGERMSPFTTVGYAHAHRELMVRHNGIRVAESDVPLLLEIVLPSVYATCHAKRPADPNLLAQQVSIGDNRKLRYGHLLAKTLSQWAENLPIANDDYERGTKQLRTHMGSDGKLLAIYHTAQDWVLIQPVKRVGLTTYVDVGLVSLMPEGKSLRLAPVDYRNSPTADPGVRLLRSGVSSDKGGHFVAGDRYIRNPFVDDVTQPPASLFVPPQPGDADHKARALEELDINNAVLLYPESRSRRKPRRKGAPVVEGDEAE